MAPVAQPCGVVVLGASAASARRWDVRSAGHALVAVLSRPGNAPCDRPASTFGTRTRWVSAAHTGGAERVLPKRGVTIGDGDPVC
jgi:hypothetical protein